MGISIWQLLIILMIILVLFGGGRLPQGLSDLGKGLRAFFDNVKNSDSDNNKKDQ
jgi:sec-independent protein translocase protein TatA